MAATRAAQGRDTKDREDTQDREDTEDTEDIEDTVAREAIEDQLATEMECSEEEVAAGYPYEDDITVIDIE